MRGLLAVIAFCASAVHVSAQIKQFWNTVHHDVQNSGRARFEGPGPCYTHRPAAFSARILSYTGDERFPCATEAVEKIEDDVYHNTGSVSFDNEFLVLGT